ncbi:reverse transcriptase domain-containing protein [Tanacetum coccineum]|uniref:Reverse transcriptase domain-containing protein n=1 Tax=Tanacetum coccineum TaxID=301880 RepID=A0ABQ4ZPZ0_9ASTR
MATLSSQNIRDNIQGYVAAATVTTISKSVIVLQVASISNQTNELKNMMTSFFQMNTASTSGSGSLPSNTVANPNDELKAITTRSGLVLDGPTVPMPPPFINPEEDERVEETLQTQNMKLIELANTPLNENCSAVILKKLPEKLGDPGKFLIPCGFSELKCKALANLGASINLMPLSVWKKIARDVFVPVGKFTFPADFVIVDYESDPRVPLILGRPFLRTARALIDVHGEEMILRDGNERLILNMRHDTSSYSNEPHQESINMIDVYNVSHEEILKDLFATNHPSGNPTPISEPETNDYFLEEFADEPAHITFPPGNNDLPFDAKSDLREIEYLLNYVPTKEMDSILEDSVDENSLDDNLDDTISKMFTNEHALDYSSPPLWDDYDDELFDLKSDFLTFPEYDSVFYEDFSEVDTLRATSRFSSRSGTLPSNTITNPKVDLKGITTRSGVAYQGPTIPTTSSSPPKVVERETEVTKDTVPPTNNGSTKDVQPPVVQVQPQVPNSEPVVAPVSALMPNLKPSIPYPSRRNDERRREKANDQIEKFYEIFKDLSFEISLTDALILMPKFASTLKALIGNKEKLSEMARTPLNEHCSAVILNKLPEKLGDPGKFLIPCDFPGMDECLALADLGASINLMPLSVWKKLSLPELTPTCMTLELADRSITQPIGIAEDVDVKVGKFQFPADFVVVDFDADPRVPLILGRSFLKTERALIDVYEGELTLRVGKEAVTFNLDQTSRYSSNYDAIRRRTESTSQKLACEEYSQEFLGFSDVITSGNPTPYYDPIVSTSSLTLTPFGDSDFLLEEVDAFIDLEDDPTSPEVDDSYYDPKGDILLLESFLNDDPSLPPPTQGNYLSEIRKELKVCEVKTDKSSIDEPLDVELKDLPPHLEYAFLEGDNKLPVIIAKDLSVEEKAALIKVLKLHKRAIAWKLSDIKGINPEFYTHEILMEEDYKPAVQHQRRVNPKIHDVIKKEVEKLLNARLIYPISDSPWVKGLENGTKTEIIRLNLVKFNYCSKPR